MPDAEDNKGRQVGKENENTKKSHMAKWNPVRWSFFSFFTDLGLGGLSRTLHSR
jgi:hypothetical protein